VGVNVRIRSARPDDAPAIARVHVETWRDAYRGIVADTTLDSLDVGQRTGKWREILSAAPDVSSLNYVAEGSDTVVGFASGGRTRQPSLSYDAELYALYVRPDFQRCGVGRRLTRAVVEELERRGFRSLMVEVFEANAAGRRFYETLGAMPLGETQLVHDGVTHPTSLYSWASLRDLGRAGG
jgi:ribosomal protein S18 acetylase RimI-like enzyme